MARSSALLALLVLGCGGQAEGEYDPFGGGMGAAVGAVGGAAGAVSGGGSGGTTGGSASAGGSGPGGSGPGGGSAGTGAGGVSGFGGNGGAGGSVSMAGAAGSMSMPVPCPSNELGSPLSTSTSGVLGTGYDNFAACSGAGPDTMFSWRAPRSGSYRIDTLGSDFDTVLSVVRDNPCSAPLQPTLCNDDFAGKQSLLLVEGEAGTELYIVVDSWAPAGGQYLLNIQKELDCPQLDISDLLLHLPWEFQAFAGTARSLSGGGVTACNGAALGLELLWRAPSSGIFTFSTAGSDFDTVLAARTGCGGSSLGCNDDGPGERGSSQLELQLELGQQIVLEVSPFLNALDRPMNTLQLTIERPGG